MARNLIDGAGGYSASSNITIGTDRTISKTDTNTTYSADGASLIMSGTTLVNPSMDFSTTAKNIGAWEISVAPKYLHCRVINCGQGPAANTEKNISTGITSASVRFVKAWGYAKFVASDNSVRHAFIPVPSFTTTSHIKLRFVYSSGVWNVCIYALADQTILNPIYVIFYYFI